MYVITGVLSRKTKSHSGSPTNFNSKDVHKIALNWDAEMHMKAKKKTNGTSFERHKSQIMTIWSEIVKKKTHL